MFVMTEEWVSFWYLCLNENLDYSRYCEARKKSDAVTRAELERRFDKIAEIYDDFGEMQGWPPLGIDDPRWKAWFEPRRHLFMVEPQEVGQPALYKSQPQHLLLAIPLHPEIDQTVKAVKVFLEGHYARQPALPPLPSPKYRLHAQVNGNPMHGYQQVRQACLTAMRSYAYDDQYECRSQRDSKLEFLRNEIGNLGWENIKASTLLRLQQGGGMSDDEFEPFRVRIDRCKRDFRAFARNAIRGRFPDDSPFDSEVIDQFWGN